MAKIKTILHGLENTAVPLLYLSKNLFRFHKFAKSTEQAQNTSSLGELNAVVVIVASHVVTGILVASLHGSVSRNTVLLGERS